MKEDLRWRYHAVAAALGLPGCAAAVLLAATLGTWFLLERPAQAQLQALEAEQERLGRVSRPKAYTSRVDDHLAASSPRAGFDARFPDERQITAVLGRLRATAARSGIVLDRGEFKVQTLPDEPLLQYSMNLPVRAPYAELRRFVRGLLREQPALALDEISLRREDARAALVDAQLRLVLFVAPAKD